MQGRRWKWSTALARAIVALVLASCGSENAPPPPERFRPTGYEVRVEGERMFATTAQPHACRELVPLVRESAARTQLFSERVLVVECADRWLRMEIDVQSGDAKVIGGAPENAAVVEAALWRLEHAALHDAAVAASLELARCTMSSRIAGVPDVVACVEQRLAEGRRAFEALAAFTPPAEDLCEWRQREAFGELVLDALSGRRQPQRFRDEQQLADLLKDFDRDRFRNILDMEQCSLAWYSRFQDFDCVAVGEDGSHRFIEGWRCNFERAAAAIGEGFAPIPGTR
jgi:hypothetical protein